MSAAADWAKAHDDYDGRAVTCMEHYAKLEPSQVYPGDLARLLHEAQVWATLASAAASRLTAEALPGVAGPMPVEVVQR